MHLSCLVSSCLVLSCLLLSCLVLSCLVLSCLVLWCVCVCWCARVLARSTLSAVSLRSFPPRGACSCANRLLHLGFVTKDEPNQLTAGFTTVSPRRAGAEQLHQAKRMIRGIGNVLFSTCSQTWNGEDPLVSLVNL